MSKNVVLSQICPISFTHSLPVYFIFEFVFVSGGIIVSVRYYLHLNFRRETQRTMTQREKRMNKCSTWSYETNAGFTPSAYTLDECFIRQDYKCFLCIHLHIRSKVCIIFAWSVSFMPLLVIDVLYLYHSFTLSTLFRRLFDVGNHWGELLNESCNIFFAPKNFNNKININAFETRQKNLWIHLLFIMARENIDSWATQ